MAMNWLHVSGQHILRSMVMTMVHNSLKQMPAVGPPQRTFLVMLCSTILALRGRVNFRHLHRSCDYSARTIARQCRRSCDWPACHQRVITPALAPQAEVISAQDASCMPKRGQQTCGLGHFCNGCAGRAARGVESSTLAVVEVTHRCACTLAVAQTPPTCATATKQAQEATLVDCYTQQLGAPHHRLPARVAYHAVDGYLAQKQYSDAVVERRLHPLTQRRGDAECRCLCTGPHPKRRGAHRTDDGKVPWQALSRFESLGLLAEAAHGHL
jgi:hypothetical protein